jgi:hypothetical protein
LCGFSQIAFLLPPQLCKKACIWKWESVVWVKRPVRFPFLLCLGAACADYYSRTYFLQSVILLLSVRSIFCLIPSFVRRYLYWYFLFEFNTPILWERSLLFLHCSLSHRRVIFDSVIFLRILTLYGTCI